MDDEVSGQSEALEVHPLNPAATRRSGGFWNEDSLPVMEWEAPTQRVVLPMHLQHALGPDVPPVLRWARRKFQEVANRHTRDMPVISQMSHYLDGWTYFGTESDGSARRVLFADESGRWYAATIGQDATGSYNVITVFGGSDHKFLANRLRSLERVVRNEK